MERTIELVSTPDCQQCKATERALEKAGVEYTKRDASVEPAAAAEVKALGHFRAPVVLVKVDGNLMTHWGGFRPDNVRVLAASQKPLGVEKVRPADLHADEARAALDSHQTASPAGATRSI